MTLDEAIRTLEDLMTTLPQVPPEQRREAVELGIEALKREKAYRPTKGLRTYDLLPGETKEKK